MKAILPPCQDRAVLGKTAHIGNAREIFRPLEPKNAFAVKEAASHWTLKAFGVAFGQVISGLVLLATLLPATARATVREVVVQNFTVSPVNLRFTDGTNVFWCPAGRSEMRADLPDTVLFQTNNKSATTVMFPEGLYRVTVTCASFSNGDLDVESVVGERSLWEWVLYGLGTGLAFYAFAWPFKFVRGLGKGVPEV